MARIPPAFASSYLDYQNYPESHTSNSILRRTFRGYRDTQRNDLAGPTKPAGAVATKPDPVSRFIFLISNGSLFPLLLSRDMLLRILAYHQAFPFYLDFLLAYGIQEEDRKLRFNGFRSQVTLVNPQPSQVIPDLNRSGRRFDLCYNLKAVAPLPKAGIGRELKWKIRQSAIYHRFDLGSGTALWMVADPLSAVKDELAEVLAADEPLLSDLRFGTLPEAFDSSLKTHLIVCQWASREWRWHLQSLEERIDRMTQALLLYDDEIPYRENITPRAVTWIQEQEDKVNEAVMAMRSNVKIMRSLQTFYQALVQEIDFPASEQKECARAVARFRASLAEIVDSLDSQLDRAQVLAKIAADRKSIVLQQLQIQNALKQESVAASMWEFSERGQKEAIAMRIITVITLLYLPPTFVSTFFSTDVVKYQDGGKGKVYFSQDALNSFLYVTIPLWVLTLVIVVLYYRWEARRKSRRPRELVSRYSEAPTRTKAA
ncbi:hypothetical protein PG985_012027 [Apiospora marii]|uniref:uncharacterized protein n=1 Tax=Apiospora marii TaxID=335849 RepID=UPI00312CDA12